MSKPRLIAFYLPQFYPTKENDMWWGKGFTEWTNVGKAKPLFKGHYQPHIPADLGYYDLRLPEIREEQAVMAREAHIEGFCYWHYWFAGKKLLNNVFEDVVASGRPNFPFCLCWANHSWYAKTWNPDIPDKLLIEQTYPGREDYIKHFYDLLPAFKDPRYMKVDNRLIFGIFAPFNIPDSKLFFDTWNSLAIKNNLSGFYFFGFTYRTQLCDNIISMGYDCAVPDYTIEAVKYINTSLKYFSKRAIKKICNWPVIVNYSDFINLTCSRISCTNRIHPCILPNYDHTPRSGTRGTVLHGSTPILWGEFCNRIFNIEKNRPREKNLIFIKSWNEWGEGNHLEPDLKYKNGFLEELKKAYENT